MACKDGSVGTKKHDFRNSCDIVQMGNLIACIKNLRVGDAQALHDLFGVFRLIVECNAQDCEFVTLVLVVYIYQIRDFCPAWRAPACPEIYNNLLPFAYKIGKLLRFALISNCKILELLCICLAECRCGE